jgi:hypothetical protein
MLVEFLYDSFGSLQGLLWYLEHLHIDNLEDFEKLFPYGLIEGKMHQWNRNISLKDTQIYFNIFRINDIDIYINKILRHPYFDDLCNFLHTFELNTSITLEELQSILDNNNFTNL